MPVGFYAYSLELQPTLFKIRLFDDTGSVLLISEIFYTVTLTNGIQYNASALNGKIPLSWYNVDNVLIIAGDCWEEQTILITPSDYANEFKDVNLVISPCIEDDNVNQGNYFTWQSLKGVNITETDVQLCSARLKECFGADTTKQGIVNPYIKNKQVKHFPIVTPYEETTFFINFDTPIDSGVIDDFELGIIDEFNNLVIASIGTITKHIVNIDNDFIYFATGIRPEAESLIPCNNYRFLIYDKTTNDSLFVSNPWKFLTEDVNDKATYLEYRNSQNIYNFDYDGLPNFLNKVRLKLYALHFDGETELEPYRSDTSGEVRNLEGTLDKFIVVETYWFDELAHVATLVLGQHDDIRMNGVEYTIKTPHQVEENTQSGVKKGIFEVIDAQFSRINRFC